MINEYRNFIFDFDGTIACLQVDWHSLKLEVDAMCASHAIETDMPLNKKIDSLKPFVNIGEILKRYEQPCSDVEYVPNNNVIKFIRNLEFYYVVTNNLHSTAKKVLDELNILEHCFSIIAIDDVSNSKPDSESYRKLKPKLKRGKSIYIGDRESDNRYAINCGLDFKNIKGLI